MWGGQGHQDAAGLQEAPTVAPFPRPGPIPRLYMGRRAVYNQLRTNGHEQVLQFCKQGRGLRLRHSHIDIRVDEGRKERIRAKAEGLGLTVTDLMLRAAEAYGLTGAEGEGGEVAAVTYGELLLAHHALSDVERALRECARQLVGTRHLIGSLARDGSLDEARTERLAGAVGECARQLSGVREQVTEGLGRVDAVARAWVRADADGTLSGPVRGS